MADVKKIATRDSYGNALKELGAEFENLVVLDADLAGATKTGTFLKAFGFEVAEIDGHDFDQMEAAFAQARATKGKPFAIVMKTTKGKNVSFMENNAGWHGKAPNDAEREQALNELNAILAGLEG